MRNIRKGRGALPSNENKMSDGGRGRASLGVEVWKSSQKWSVQRSAVRSIAWLGLFRVAKFLLQACPTVVHQAFRLAKLLLQSPLSDGREREVSIIQFLRRVWQTKENPKSVETFLLEPSFQCIGTPEGFDSAERVEDSFVSR